MYSFQSSIDELVYLRSRGLMVSMEAGVGSQFAQELESEFFVTAAALEPRFKLLWVQDDKVEVTIAVVRRNISSVADRYRTATIGKRQ